MEVTLREAADLLPTYFDAGITVELQSSPGLGKSDMIEQLLKKLSDRDGFEWGYAECFLATQSPPDLLGYMMPQDKEVNGEQLRVSTWTLPIWMQTKNDKKPLSHYRRGILFLDEYGQGEADVKRASAQLLLKGELGPWKLPDGWVIVAASNRSADRSGVTKSFDFVINRRAELHIQPDVDAWVDWATTAGVTPITITFARKNPQIVFEGKVPEKQGPWCTPRSLVMADKLLKNMPAEDLAENRMAFKAVTSLIGEAAARQYFVFLKLEEEVPDIEDIVANPAKAKVPEKPDVQMLTAYHLASVVKLKTMDPVIAYIERLSKDFSVTFIKAAMQRDSGLAASPAFMTWCKNNSALMASVR